MILWPSLRALKCPTVTTACVRLQRQHSRKPRADRLLGGMVQELRWLKQTHQTAAASVNRAPPNREKNAFLLRGNWIRQPLLHPLSGPEVTTLESAISHLSLGLSLHKSLQWVRWADGNSACSEVQPGTPSDWLLSACSTVPRLTSADCQSPYCSAACGSTTTSHHDPWPLPMRKAPPIWCNFSLTRSSGLGCKVTQVK